MRETFAKHDVYYGWGVVGACFIGSMVTYGISYSFGVFFDPIAETFDASRGNTSLIFSIHTFVMYGSAVVVGVLIDRYGVRNLTVLGAGLIGSGLGLSSQVTSLFGLIMTYGVIVSAGLGIIYIISYATIPRWFERRRGLAGGIASSGLGVGVLVIAPGAAILIGFFGWRTAYLLVAVVMTFLLLVVALLIADEPEKNEVIENEFILDQSTNLENSFLTEAKHALLTPSFQLLLIGWILIYSTLFAVFVNLPVHTGDIGLGNQVGAVGLGVIGAVSIGSRLGVGFVSDRVGRTKIFVICSTIMGVTTVVLPFIETSASIYIFSVVYGIGYGGNGALLAPIVADFFGTASINTLFGLTSAGFGVSGLIFPYLIGLSHDLFNTYTLAFVSTGVLGVIGAVLVMMANRIHER